MKKLLMLITAAMLTGCSFYSNIKPKQPQIEKEIVIETITTVIEPPASLLKIYKLPDIDVGGADDTATTQVAMATMVVELSRVKRKYENNILLLRKYVSDIKNKKNTLN